MPKIIEILGYVPFDTSTKIVSEKIVTYRKLLGFSQKRLANQLGIDPSTLGNWEKNERHPSERFLKDLVTFFRSYPSGA
jgi:transcriptional regulator with XRE-family HTH domain